MADEELTTQEMVEVARQAAKQARVFQRIYEVAVQLHASWAALDERQAQVKELDTAIDRQRQTVADLEATITATEHRLETAVGAAVAAERQAKHRVAQAVHEAEIAIQAHDERRREVEVETEARIHNLETAHATRLQELDDDFRQRVRAIAGETERMEQQRTALRAELDGLVARVTRLGLGGGDG